MFLENLRTWSPQGSVKTQTPGLDVALQCGAPDCVAPPPSSFAPPALCRAPPNKLSKSRDPCLPSSVLRILTVDEKLIFAKNSSAPFLWVCQWVNLSLSINETLIVDHIQLTHCSVGDPKWLIAMQVSLRVQHCSFSSCVIGDTLSTALHSWWKFYIPLPGWV